MMAEKAQNDDTEGKDRELDAWHSQHNVGVIISFVLQM